MGDTRIVVTIQKRVHLKSKTIRMRVGIKLDNGLRITVIESPPVFGARFGSKTNVIRTVLSVRYRSAVVTDNSIGSAMNLKHIDIGNRC